MEEIGHDRPNHTHTSYHGGKRGTKNSILLGEANKFQDLSHKSIQLGCNRGDQDKKPYPCEDVKKTFDTMIPKLT